MVRLHSLTHAGFILCWVSRAHNHRSGCGSLTADANAGCFPIDMLGDMHHWFVVFHWCVIASPLTPELFQRSCKCHKILHVFVYLQLFMLCNRRYSGDKVHDMTGFVIYARWKRLLFIPDLRLDQAGQVRES